MRPFFLLLTCLILWTSCQKQTSKTITSTTLIETTKSWNGNLLPKIEGQPKVTITKIVIPPKTKLPNHLHPVITTGILLKGELTVTTAQGEQTILREGDALVEVSNTLHYGENTGNTDIEIVVFYIGGEHQPLTILAPSEQP